MSNLREEITRTVLRLSGRGEDPRVLSNDVTVLKPDPREGQKLGSYRILRRLGHGGMGHVYLALDTRLGRHVALKFLAHESTADHSMLYRLQQEARTTSALNHPNIVTVYEVGELGGEHFIASEFIDGATLRSAMQRNAIDVPTALDVAVQVASALVAAHSAGVVHRDLKPGNIMLRPDGYVKVIDFGLAKQIERRALAASREEFVTRPGSVIGTVNYMSPEQARGDRVDHRTDIWSLGVVLYEMVARRRPFEGQTESHIIVSILDSPLPPLPDRKSLPPGLSRVLEGSLAKDPAKRYQSVSALLDDLQQLSPVSRSGRASRFAGLERRRRTIPAKLLPLVLAAVLAVACLAWWWNSRLPEWFQIGSVRQLTYNGRTRLATISPDGNYLAFAVGEKGDQQALYLKQIDSSTEEIKIPARRVDYVGLTFSPDSRYLFITEKDDALMGRLYAMPILGSRPATALIEDIDGPVSFSPDAAHFAFVRFKPFRDAGRDQVRSTVFVSSRDGYEKRPLLSTSDMLVYECLAWSPEGNRIAAILFPNPSSGKDDPQFDLIALNGKQSILPLPKWRLIGRPSWTPDGKTVILTAVDRTQSRNQAQIRQIDVDDGQTHDITVGLGGFRAASITHNGAQIAATKIESRATLWVSAPRDFSTGQTFLAEAEQRPTLDWLDSNHMVLNSQRSGYPNLWLFDLNTQAGSSLTNGPYAQEQAASFRDGKSIVFASNRSGESKIWRFDRDTAVTTQLTFGPNYDEAPTVSPDGGWIVYTSWAGTLPHLWKVPSNGGASMQVTPYLARDAQFSPDGKFIACYLEATGSALFGVAIIPVNDPDSPRFLPYAHVPLRWTHDSTAVTSVVTDANGVSNIWRVPLDGSAPRQLTRFDDQIIRDLAWSPNGDQIACLRVRLGADVALFSRQQLK